MSVVLIFISGIFALSLDIVDIILVFVDFLFIALSILSDEC